MSTHDRRKPPYLGQKLAATVIPVHGNGRLLPGGQPGHRGAGGRPPNSYKDWVKELFESDEARTQIKRIIEDADHPAFSAVFGKLLVYVLGPPQSVVADDETPYVVLDI